MATRQHAREAVIALLYAHDSGNPEIDSFFDEILEERKIRNKQRDFAKALFDGCLEHITTIDVLIQEHMKEWELSRVGRMERAILRLGCHELLHTQTDPAVVINEAIEMSKKFADDNAPKFINGILDSIRSDKNAALRSA